MVKCGACGKFLTATAGLKCCKYSVCYHNGCVVVSDAGPAGSKWLCTEYKVYSLEPKSSAKAATGFHTHPSPASLDESIQSISAIDTKADLVLEIRSFRKELHALRAEVRECCAEIAHFKGALKLCQENISNMDSRISALESKFEERIPANVDSLEDTISELKYQLNEREQESLMNDVEGVNEQKEESLFHYVKVMATKLGVEIDDREIAHVTRVGSSRRNRVNTDSISADTAALKPRCIAVTFVRRATRHNLLRAARVRRGLASTDAEVVGPSRPVYINERLTSVNRRLFYRAKQSGRQHNWQYIWTWDGKIFARKDDGKQAERIRSDNDIIKVFGSITV